MTWTKEREDWIRECVSRNPEMETVEGHDWRGRAADLLSWLDAEREARQRAERERDEARADEQKARDLLLASEHARQSLRAERDAILARLDVTGPVVRGLASERGVSIAEDRGVERQRSTRVVLLGVVSRTEDDHGT